MELTGPNEAALPRVIAPIEAILALVRVMTRPGARVFQARSNSDKIRFYALTYEAEELSCTCSGFQYRGMCSHARTLKQVLVRGGKLRRGMRRR